MSRTTFLAAFALGATLVPAGPRTTAKGGGTADPAALAVSSLTDREPDQPPIGEGVRDQHGLEPRGSVLLAVNADAVAASLTTTLLALGKTEEAERRRHDDLMRSQRVLGPTHELTIMARLSVAGLLSSSGRADEALPELTATLDDVERAYGPDHPLTLKTLDELAYTNSTLGRFEESREWYGRAIEVARHVHGAEHWQVGRFLRERGYSWASWVARRTGVLSCARDYESSRPRWEAAPPRREPPRPCSPSSRNGWATPRKPRRSASSTRLNEAGPGSGRSATPVAVGGGG